MPKGIEGANGSGRTFLVGRLVDVSGRKMDPDRTGGKTREMKERPCYHYAFLGLPVRLPEIRGLGIPFSNLMV